MTDEVRKIGVTIPISNEALGFMPPQWLEVAMGLRPDPRTPEQIAADRAAYRADVDRAHADIRERHSVALREAEDVARAVLELHAPVLRENGMTADCGGCDWSGYEGEPPEWPCRTYELITGEQS